MFILAAKRIGFHVLYWRENESGEWAVRAEPDRLQVDAFHGLHRVHVHDPLDYVRTFDVGSITFARARRVVATPLERNDRVILDKLLEELRG